MMIFLLKTSNYKRLLILFYESKNKLVFMCRINLRSFVTMVSFGIMKILQRRDVRKWFYSVLC
jgi:hypothetical protein